MVAQEAVSFRVDRSPEAECIPLPKGLDFDPQPAGDALVIFPFNDFKRPIRSAALRGTHLWQHQAGVSFFTIGLNFQKS